MPWETLKISVICLIFPKTCHDQRIQESVRWRFKILGIFEFFVTLGKIIRNPVHSLPVLRSNQSILRWRDEVVFLLPRPNFEALGEILRKEVWCRQFSIARF